MSDSGSHLLCLQHPRQSAFTSAYKHISVSTEPDKGRGRQTVTCLTRQYRAYLTGWQQQTVLQLMAAISSATGATSHGARRNGVSVQWFRRAFYSHKQFATAQIKNL